MAAQIVATASGLTMVAAAGIGSHGPARTMAAVAVLAVLVGIPLRSVATFAVLLTVAAIAWANPAAIVVAASGLFAVCYLVLRHAASGATGLNSVSGATMVSAAGFTVVGLVATAFPLQVRWLPLIAPLAAFAVYLLATRPYLRDGDD